MLINPQHGVILTVELVTAYKCLIKDVFNVNSVFVNVLKPSVN